MKTHGVSRTTYHAFSLVETTIAISIVATVLLPVMAMIGQGQLSQSESVDRVMATFIAESVVEEISGSLSRDSQSTASDEEQLSIAVLSTGEELKYDAKLMKAGGASIYLEFDSSGRLSADCSTEEFRNGRPSNDKDGGGFLVEVVFVKDANTPTGLTKVTTRVGAPIYLDSGARSRQEFTTFMRLGDG